MQPSTPEEEFAWRWENCAFHEAGHAVAFASYDIRMEVARLLHKRKNPNSVEGYVSIDDGDILAADPDGLVVGILAGLAAQAVWYHRIGGFDRSTARRHAEDGARDGDLQVVRRYMKNSRMSFGQARNESRRLVLNRWAAITRVGNALKARGELSNRDIYRFAR